MPRPTSTSQPVTLEQLVARLDALERRVEQATSNGVSPRWWEEHAGQYKDDPGFNEIVRLGRRERRKENARPRDAKRKQLARP